MHAHAIRQLFLVSITGIGLYVGGAISRYVASAPSFLYAAGELRILLGDHQGGVELVGRAEAARATSKSVSDTPPTVEPKPASAPSEICSRPATSKPRASSLQSSLASEPDSNLIAAAFPPAPPAPPQAIAHRLHGIGREGFDSLGRHWPDVSVKRVHIDLSNVMSPTQLKELREAQHRFRDGKMNAVIIREVRRNLERQNVPLLGGIMVREMLVTPEPPAIDQ